MTNSRPAFSYDTSSTSGTSRIPVLLIGFTCYVDNSLKSNFLFFSHSISQALKTVQVKNQLVKTARARLVIFCASKRILDMGMRILGIEPLCEM